MRRVRHGAGLCALQVLLMLAFAGAFRGVRPPFSRRGGCSAGRPGRCLATEEPLAEAGGGLRAAGDLPELTFVTSNDMKLREVRMILGSDFPFDVKREDIDLYELQGEPELISLEKCRLAAEQVDGPVFVEDTSLFLEGLNGMPGPYIKWFLDALGGNGLQELLNGRSRVAEAQCCLAFSAGKGAEPMVFKGRCKGVIKEPSGEEGFGWDEIFVPDGADGRTFGQMSREEKNRLSHRSRALRAFRDHLMDGA